MNDEKEESMSEEMEKDVRGIIENVSGSIVLHYQCPYCEHRDEKRIDVRTVEVTGMSCIFCEKFFTLLNPLAAKSDESVKDEFGTKDENEPTRIIPTAAALRQLAVAVQHYMNCPCAGHRLSVSQAQEEAGKWY